MKRALIVGVSGQDGAYLAKFLLSKGYQVSGTSRDALSSNFSNLSRLGINNMVRKYSMAVNDFHSVLSVVKHSEPNEIYNLSGQSSVSLSFDKPAETFESIIFGTLYILEAIRFLDRSIRFYNAGTGDSFGDTLKGPANEDTPFSPKSPYAIAKTTAYRLVKNYQDSYNLYACTGILFNHESPLRPNHFVTQKIINAATAISMGSNRDLKIGNINIHRDWGWAPEFVEAMWLMLQQKSPETFLIATGKTVSLEYFIEKSFSYYGLDWKNHVIVDSNLFRPSDITYGSANPKKAENILKWKAKLNVEDIIKIMCAETKKNIN